jgi:PhnB protein
MQVQPYLLFDGRCDEALEYYRKAVGAEVEFLMRMKDSPGASESGKLAPGSEDKVMHCSFRIGDTIILATDGGTTSMESFSGKPVFSGFQLTLSVATEAEATRVFAALSDGGRVRQALTKTFFSPLFGMLTDRFGVAWVVLVPQQ